MYIRIVPVSERLIHEIIALAVLFLLVAITVVFAILMASGEASALASVVDFSCPGTHGGFVTQSSFERVFCP